MSPDEPDARSRYRNGLSDAKEEYSHVQHRLLAGGGDVRRLSLGQVPAAVDFGLGPAKPAVGEINSNNGRTVPALRRRREGTFGVACLGPCLSRRKDSARPRPRNAAPPAATAVPSSTESHPMLNLPSLSLGQPWGQPGSAVFLAETNHAQTPSASAVGTVLPGPTSATTYGADVYNRPLLLPNRHPTTSYFTTRPPPHDGTT